MHPEETTHRAEPTRPEITQAEGFRLHIGCGSNVVGDWINIDKSPNVLLSPFPRARRVLHRAGVLTDRQASAVFPPGIVRMDVRRGLPFPDTSTRLIYSSHLIEHLSRWQGLGFLRECQRVLVRGGLIRLATPDLRELTECYRRGEAPHGPTAADSFMHELWTFREAEENVVQRTVRRLITAPHQWLYDEQSLANLLMEAGFSQPEVRNYRTGAMPDLEQLEHRPDSLFIEALKP